MQAKHAGAAFAGRRAVVVGGTSGIGQGIAMRLAQASYAVTIVGRDEKRGQQILQEMNALQGSKLTAQPAHAFEACDASLLSNIHKCTALLASRGGPLDVLVLTQGTSGSTRQDTVEGIDKKLALHYYGRIAFIQDLLPSLRKSASPKVLTILSAGTHSAYSNYETDPELRSSYGMKSSYDAPGFYTDIALDSLSHEPGNEHVAFIHANPGFTSTRFGFGPDTPWYMHAATSIFKVFARTPEESAEYMVDPVFDASIAGGFLLLGQYATPVSKTTLHDTARDAVWKHTQEVLARVPPPSVASVVAAGAGVVTHPLK
jgi:NAD(P)-dependent dehydrogenase (short-subunit alcohol dehydrogenase family)